jgi:hypothetical protein
VVSLSPHEHRVIKRLLAFLSLLFHFVSPFVALSPVWSSSRAFKRQPFVQYISCHVGIVKVLSPWRWDETGEVAWTLVDGMSTSHFINTAEDVATRSWRAPDARTR